MAPSALPTLERLAADAALACQLLGPRGRQIVALLAMVAEDSPRRQFEAATRRWNLVGAEHQKSHHRAIEAAWTGARRGGRRRGWLQNIDRYVESRPHDGPWRDSATQMLLADACAGEVARSWIGEAAAARLVRDWFYAWLGVT